MNKAKKHSIQHLIKKQDQIIHSKNLFIEQNQGYGRSLITEQNMMQWDQKGLEMGTRSGYVLGMPLLRALPRAPLNLLCNLTLKTLRGVPVKKTTLFNRDPKAFLFGQV